MADTTQTTADLKTQLTANETADLVSFKALADKFNSDVATLFSNNISSTGSNSTIASQFFSRMKNNLSSMFGTDLSNVLNTYGVGSTNTVTTNTATPTATP